MHGSPHHFTLFALWFQRHAHERRVATRLPPRWPRRTLHRHRSLPSGWGAVVSGQLITKREAADILGVTPSSVHRMIDRQELVPADSIMAGDKVVAYLFNLDDVKQLAKTRIA